MLILNAWKSNKLGILEPGCSYVVYSTNVWDGPPQVAMVHLYRMKQITVANRLPSEDGPVVIMGSGESHVAVIGYVDVHNSQNVKIFIASKRRVTFIIEAYLTKECSFRRYRIYWGDTSTTVGYATHVTDCTILYISHRKCPECT